MATFYTDAIYGSDLIGDGSSVHPWALPSYAASRVLTAGDLIYIRPGTYHESVPILLAPGVSLMGAGDTSEIISTYPGTEFDLGCLNCRSYATVIDGNQSISYIKLDCTLSSVVGIYLAWRNNITISHITLTRAIKKGIWIGTYIGSEDYLLVPHDYSDNFTVEYSSFDNNMNDIFLHGIRTMDIHHNTFREVDRTGTGIPARAFWGMWISGIKYHDNVSYKPADANNPIFTWNFTIEEWNGEGGNEIYNNVFNGGGQFIDISGRFNLKGSYDYSWWIHDNIFTLDMTVPHAVGNLNYGIAIEGSNENLMINHNIFINLDYGISLQNVNYWGSNTYIRDVVIHHNICQNTGDDRYGYGTGAVNFQCLGYQYSFPFTTLIENIYLLNNVFSGSTLMRRNLHFRTDGTIQNVVMRNNVVEHQYTYITEYPYGWLEINVNGPSGEIGIIKDFIIENNHLFDNMNDNEIIYPGNLTGTLVYQNNQKEDTLFRVPRSDYHLTYNSASRANGIDPSLDPALSAMFPSYMTDTILLDFDGRAIVGPDFDIGAYIFEGTLCKILSMFYNTAAILKEKILKTNFYSARLVRDSTTLPDGGEGTYVGNDGKIYRTIAINGKEYLSDNLVETRYRNGEAIAEVTNPSLWPGLTTGALVAYNNDWDNV